MACGSRRSRKISGVVLVNWFDKYVGLPFSDGKLDCWGLACQIYKNELNIILPRYGEISAFDLAKVALKITAGKDSENWQAVERSDLMPFDMVVMRYATSRRVGHVGVAIDKTRFIHTEKVTNAVIVPYSHYSVRERLECFRRYKSAAKS
jgi:cell wall-associated NlpC family hydrolase